MRLYATHQRNRRTGGGGLVASGKSVPAPVAGWDSISPLAAMAADRAIVLDNWFPQPGYIELRRGHTLQSNTGVNSPVESLMAYHALTTVSDKLFAANGGSVYDVTGAASSQFSGMTNARWQHVNFATSGGHFLWICNGADAPRYWDGAAWVVPTITGITAANIVHVNVHKNRLWFVLINSTKAAYLPTNSIAGAATEFELGPLFTMGGFLVAMGTWSVDGGDGPEDYAAFISSKGQVAIYSGTDPDSASTWALKGVFQIGPPIGRRCFTRVGADLAVISIDGVLPISRALVIERGVSVSVSLTANIQPTMNQAARDWKDNFGWQLISYPKGTRAYLNVPALQGSSQQQYVMNTVTGAWCRFLGMGANCWETFKERVFFGGNDGKVYEADATGSDNGVAIAADCKTAFNYFGRRGNLKRWPMIRPLLTTDGVVVPGMAMNVDFRDDAPISTPSSSPSAAAMWDVALWDVDLWPLGQRTTADWTTINAIGYCGSIRTRVSVNAPGATAPVLQINGFDVLMEMGAFI